MRIQGLTAEEGNRCIGLTMECRSSIAGKTCRSVWKRSAALSASGFVRIPSELSGALEPRSFSTPGADGVSRSWEGFTTKIPGAEGLPESFRRPDLALGDVERPPGLDLISRMGSVRIELLP